MAQPKSVSEGAAVLRVGIIAFAVGCVAALVVYWNPYLSRIEFGRSIPVSMQLERISGKPAIVISGSSDASAVRVSSQDVVYHVLDSEGKEAAALEAMPEQVNNDQWHALGNFERWVEFIDLEVRYPHLPDGKYTLTATLRPATASNEVRTYFKDTTLWGGPAITSRSMPFVCRGGKLTF